MTLSPEFAGPFAGAMRLIVLGLYSWALSLSRPAAGQGRTPVMMSSGGSPLRFTVGLKLKGKSDRVVVDGEDALIAALKAKAHYPDALITYVRRQNRRGDARHPAHALAKETLLR